MKSAFIIWASINWIGLVLLIKSEMGFIIWAWLEIPFLFLPNIDPPRRRLQSPTDHALLHQPPTHPRPRRRRRPCRRRAHPPGPDRREAGGERGEGEAEGAAAGAAGGVRLAGRDEGAVQGLRQQEGPQQRHRRRPRPPHHPQGPRLGARLRQGRVVAADSILPRLLFFDVGRWSVVQPKTEKKGLVFFFLPLICVLLL